MSSTAPEATVDLSGLSFTEEREGPYFDALDDILDVLLDRHEDLPERLYLADPSESGARVLLWNRDGCEVTVERVVRRMQEDDADG